jgi:putative salt-induced outer membrane protein YdiY
LIFSLLVRAIQARRVPVLGSCVDTGGFDDEAEPMLFLLLVLTLNTGPSLQEQFLDLEDLLISGLQSKDAARLGTLLADDYLLRGRPDIDRATWIRNAVTLCWGEKSEIEEFKAREVGGTIITSFILTMHQDPVTCKPATIRSLITDVWRKQNEEWRLAVRHSGPIGSAGADPVAQQFFREEPPPPRWEATSELSFVSTGGNADVQTLGIGLSTIHRTNKWETAANGSFVRSVADGLESARSLTAGLRQSVKISPRLDLFGRSSYRRDLFAGIEHRGSLDAGLGFKLVNTGAQQLKIDLGSGYLREERSNGPALSSAILNNVNTWRWQVREALTFANDVAITLPLEDAHAWRVSNLFSVTTALTDMFAVKLSYSTNYLNRPVPGFGRTDTIASAALVTRFRSR